MRNSLSDWQEVGLRSQRTHTHTVCTLSFASSSSTALCLCGTQSNILTFLPVCVCMHIPFNVSY